MPKKKFIKIGQKFNRLTIIKECKSYINPYSKKEIRKVLCQCDCGNKKEIIYQHLKNGNTKSCGCLNKEGNNLKHGMFKTKFYNIFRGILQRCNDKNNYYNYSDKRIKCEWKNFEEFKRDMYKNYLEHKKNNNYTSIDRKNNDGNYCKDNCRWATRKEQNNNKNNNCLIIYNNRTQTVAQWAKELNISYHLLYNRIYKLNWSIKKAFRF